MDLTDKTLLGELLIKARVINENQLNQALQLQKTEGRKLGSALLKLGAVTEENIITFLSRQYHVPPVNLTNFKYDPALIKYVPYDVAKRYKMIPLMLAGGNLRLAVADPSNHVAIEDIKFMNGLNVSVYVAIESVIMEAIENYYPKSEKQKKTLGDPNEKKSMPVRPDEVSRSLDNILDELTVAAMPNITDQKEIDQPVENMLKGILVNAVKYHASDIHIEPGEDLVRVRLRIDGVLKSVLKLPVQMKASLTARVKKIFNLDTAETRVPQSGRTKFRFGVDKEIDSRVSTFPTMHGERIVMKLTDRSHMAFDLAKLGFDEKQLRDFIDAISRPQGIILVSGPNDSGKTTTIYSALLHLNRPGINIMTAEDPIEFNLFGMNQGQIRPEIGLTFASAIESFLIQDPDVIMIGELQDTATSELAIKSALTGHLILSTLPAKDAAGVIARMISMGTEPFAVASTVSLAVSQRLVRKICENCKTVQNFDETALLKIGFPSDMIGSFTCYTGAGCDKCNNTGYIGRTAIFEVMPVNADVQELIMKNASAVEIRHKAVMSGLSTLRQSGIQKILDGITSVDEVLRVTFED